LFTGIVEELGTLRARRGSRFEFSAATVLQDSVVGGSISVNGCCLTVVDIGDRWWAADAVDETLSRTNLGSLAVGDHVNLERPVRLADRLGGHLVQGHVDAVGVIESPAPDLEIRTDPALLRYIVEKGSITIDGVSLTIVAPTATGFTVALIPHTMAVTTLGRKRRGDIVNLEVDVMAKYAERLLSAHIGAAP
jgi:riboflavin synthase